MELREFIKGMPKAENHLHFDGSTYPASVIELSKRNNVKLPFSTIAEAEESYKFNNLGDFIKTVNMVCSVIVTAEDFKYLTLEIARDAHEQNICYRDVMLSCAYHEKRGIPFAVMMKGFIAGREEAMGKYGVYLAAIPEIDRTISPDESLEFIDRMIEFKDAAKIVAIGLDGPESGFPAHVHAAAFARAKELGLKLTAHAGEDYGPVSISDALDYLKVDRIDHGIRAIEDSVLVKRLAEEKILLTICPLSNVGLKVYPDLQSHSFKRLLDAGVPVTVNSDDPPFFQGNLIDNYVAVVEAFDLSIDELYEIAKNSFVYSYAPASLIENKVAELEAYFKRYAHMLK